MTSQAVFIGGPLDLSRQVLASPPSTYYVAQMEPTFGIGREGDPLDAPSFYKAVYRREGSPPGTDDVIYTFDATQTALNRRRAVEAQYGPTQSQWQSRYDEVLTKNLELLRENNDLRDANETADKARLAEKKRADDLDEEAAALRRERDDLKADLASARAGRKFWVEAFMRSARKVYNAQKALSGQEKKSPETPLRDAVAAAKSRAASFEPVCPPNANCWLCDAERARQ